MQPESSITRTVERVDTLNLRTAADKPATRRKPRSDHVIELRLPVNVLIAFLRAVAYEVEISEQPQALSPGLALANEVARLVERRTSEVE